VKELYTIKEGYHHLFIDYEKDIYYTKIVDWINSTLKVGKTNKRIHIINII
jgi:hypothetical protein